MLATGALHIKCVQAWRGEALRPLRAVDQTLILDDISRREVSPTCRGELEGHRLDLSSRIARERS
jgi:hypothetical protein